MAFHVHHGPLAVHSDPKNPLLGVLIEAKDAEVAVDDLLAVGLGSPKLHQSIGPKCDHQVIVKGDDTHDRAVFLQQRRDIPDVYLDLTQGIVDIEVLVRIDKTEGLVVLTEEHLDGPVVEARFRKDHSADWRLAIEGINRDPIHVARTRGIGEQPQFAGSADKHLPAGIRNRNMDSLGADKPVEPGIIVGDAVGTDHPGIALCIRTQVALGRESVAGHHATPVARKEIHSIRS